jgi:hypothetical protein
MILFDGGIKEGVVVLRLTDGLNFYEVKNLGDGRGYCLIDLLTDPSLLTLILRFISSLLLP